MGAVTHSVEQALRSIIEGLQPGERLPSERTLVQQLGASRTTVRLVLTRLTAEGLARPEHGRGYFVAGDHPDG